MSRVSKNPVIIPDNVTIKIVDASIVVTGPKGIMELIVQDNVLVNTDEKKIFFSMKQSNNTDAIAGTTRMLVYNMIIGVTKGFEKKLILIGVGYKAQIANGILNLSLGFSHPVIFPVPVGIQVEMPNQTEIILKGIDKHLVGQVAAKIRGFRSPEPYKGKGIRYENEIIIKKEGKKK